MSFGVAPRSNRPSPAIQVPGTSPKTLNDTQDSGLAVSPLSSAAIESEDVSRSVTFDLDDATSQTRPLLGKTSQSQSQSGRTSYGSAPVDYAGMSQFRRYSSFERRLRSSSFLGSNNGSLISINHTTPEDLIISQRYENLLEMRPYRLIGKSTPLAAWDTLRQSPAQLAKIRNPAVRRFYEAQNELIDRYCEVDGLLDSGIPVNMLRAYGRDLDEFSASSPDPDGTSARQGAPVNLDAEAGAMHNAGASNAVVMLAIYVNFAVNVFLLVGKTVVAILTSSLSVMASLVDSVMDFLSTIIIWASARLVGQTDWKTKYAYPVGRSRLEPIGVLVFSIIMIVSFIQVGSESLRRLWGGDDGQVPNLGVASVTIMGLTVLSKWLCWLWCRSVASSAVQALAQDAMTDVVFNVFSLLFPLAGNLLGVWWLDPFGALALSCYVVWSWGATALEHIDNLTGSAASLEDRQVLLYLVYRFADSIREITALNAYHTGDRLMVEVDVILDSSFNLKDCHDIAEAMQYALETLPIVERAYVHLDYRRGNYAGHLDR